MNRLKQNLKSLLQVIVSIVNIVRNYKKANLEIRKNVTHQCYVLGNGPSLALDIDYVDRDADFIVVNNFVNTKHYQSLKPKYYILADPIFWSDHKFREELITIRDKVLNKICDDTSWKLSIVIPSFVKKSSIIYQKVKTYPNLTIQTYFPVTVNGPDRFKFYCYDKMLGTPPTQNVLVAGIYVAIYLKYKHINILGADHSWHEDVFIDDDNILCLKDRHFYDKDSSKIKGKPWKKGNGENFRMSELLPTLGRMFKGYDELQKYALHKNIRIVNQSSISYIDAFKRTPIK